MGLDALELVMAVEEKFNIEISDQEAQHILTVGEFQRLILSKLNISDESTCMTQQAFHMIRRQAMNTFSIPRRGFKPDTPLSSIVPKENRQLSWSNFQSSLGLSEMPELVRPGGITATITALSLGILVVAIWIGVLTKSLGTWSAVGGLIAALVGWSGAELTKSMKTEFQEGYSRVRDLARYVVARHPQILGRQRVKSRTEEEVRCLLREVIISQTGVSDFNDNSRFVADLHLD